MKQNRGMGGSSLSRRVREDFSKEMTFKLSTEALKRAGQAKRDDNSFAGEGAAC